MRATEYNQKQRIRKAFEEEERPLAFVGLRSCDLHAIEVQDRVFLELDPAYRRRRERAVFDIVFIDPPYGGSELGGAMARLAQWPEMVSEAGIIVLQRSRHDSVAERVGVIGKGGEGEVDAGEFRELGIGNWESGVR